MQGIATFGHVVGVLHTGKFKGKLTLSFSQKGREINYT